MLKISSSSAQILVDGAGGIVDANYCGNVCVILFNFLPKFYKIEIGDRIAQIILENILIAQVEEVEKLVETERDSSGFGLTNSRMAEKIAEATLDKYCCLENLSNGFNNKYVSEDENFISQNITTGLMVIWIHCFRNSNVPILECLDFLNELQREKYGLRDWSRFFVMEGEVQDFETDVSIIYRIFSTNGTEIEKYNNFALEYFS